LRLQLPVGLKNPIPRIPKPFNGFEVRSGLFPLALLKSLPSFGVEKMFGGVFVLRIDRLNALKQGNSLVPIFFPDVLQRLTVYFFQGQICVFGVHSRYYTRNCLQR
jgi:hypothetical protein